jgi:hypothetical protein
MLLDYTVYKYKYMGEGGIQAIQSSQSAKLFRGRKKTQFSTDKEYTQNSHRVSSHPLGLTHHSSNSLFVNHQSLIFAVNSTQKQYYNRAKMDRLRFLTKTYQHIYINHISNDSRLVASTNASNVYFHIKRQWGAVRNIKVASTKFGNFNPSQENFSY